MVICKSEQPEAEAAAATARSHSHTLSSLVSIHPWVLPLMPSFSLVRISEASSIPSKFLSSIAMVFTYILILIINLSLLSIQPYTIRLTWSLGVIWKGDELIDGVSQTLHMLRSNVHHPSLSLFSHSLFHPQFSFHFFLIGEEAGVSHQQFLEVQDTIRSKVPIFRNSRFPGLPSHFQF